MPSSSSSMGESAPALARSLAVVDTHCRYVLKVEEASSALECTSTTQSGEDGSGFVGVTHVVSEFGSLTMAGVF